jgi:hypothetical protein
VAVAILCRGTSARWGSLRSVPDEERGFLPSPCQPVLLIIDHKERLLGLILEKLQEPCGPDMLVADGL